MKRNIANTLTIIICILASVGAIEDLRNKNNQLYLFIGKTIKLILNNQIIFYFNPLKTL